MTTQEPRGLMRSRLVESRKQPGAYDPNPPTDTGFRLWVRGAGSEADRAEGLFTVYRIGTKLFVNGDDLEELMELKGFVLLSEVLDTLIQMLGDAHSDVASFEMIGGLR